MANNEQTTDNQKVSFRIATFIFIIFSVASMSFTISGIISEISSDKDDLVAEQYARNKNDKRLQDQINEMDKEHKRELKELKESIKFYIENER